MTLKEWAEREGVGYTDAVWLRDEYELLECVLILPMAHCFDCADIYLARDMDGRLWKTCREYSWSESVVIQESDLDSLHRTEWSY